MKGVRIMSKAKHVSEQEQMDTEDEAVLANWKYSDSGGICDSIGNMNDAAQLLTLRIAMRTAVALERIADNLDNIAEAADQVEE